MSKSSSLIELKACYSQIAKALQIAKELQILRRVTDEKELMLFAYSEFDLEAAGKGGFPTLIAEVEDQGISWDLIES